MAPDLFITGLLYFVRTLATLLKYELPGIVETVCNIFFICVIRFYRLYEENYDDNFKCQFGKILQH